MLGTQQYGQLGDGNINRHTPMDVVGLTSSVIAIAAGMSHLCAHHGGGEKCWGGNEYGQLGDGPIGRHIPIDVVGLTSGVAAISADGVTLARCPPAAG